MLQQRGTITMGEITDQPECWKESIRIFNENRTDLINWMKTEAFQQIVLTGCGNSYYIVQAGWNLLHKLTRFPVYAYPSSDLLFSERLPFDARRKTLLIACSRSGESSETVWAVEKMIKENPMIKVMSLTCKRDNSLARLATKSAAIERAFEQGSVATRSFTSMFLYLALIGARISANEKLLAELTKVSEIFDPLQFKREIQKIGVQKFPNITFLGSGLNHSLACEAALKMKEIALIPSDSYRTLEFRHGHLTCITPLSLVVFILSDGEIKKAELEVLRDVAHMRGQIMVVADELEQRVVAGVEFSFELKTGMSEIGRAVLTSALMQLIAFHWAMAKSANPDKPKHLAPFVSLKEKPF